MPRRGKKGHGEDSLLVQVALRIKAPEGTTFSKKVLQDILDRIVSGRKLPSVVEVRGIFWRNPDRRGELGYWRYHKGADLSVAPHPIQEYPRGSLQDAIDSLGDAISAGVVTF